MPFPAPLALLLIGGAAYLALAPKKQQSSTGGAGPAVPPSGGGTTVTIPPNVLTNPPGVTPDNAPTVSVQIPSYSTNPAQVPAGGYATGDKSSQPTAPAQPAPAAQTPAQIITQALPQLMQQTPQQVITQSLPQIATQVAQALPSTASFPPLPGQPAAIPSVVIPTTPITPTPVQTGETAPTLDPNGTIQLAKDMIDAESSPGWKAAMQDRIRAWQGLVGLTADGKFGRDAAYKMALEVGILPLVRYWPKSTQLAPDLAAYRDRLYTMAANADNKNPAMAAALRASAAYEKGQAYTGTPGPIDPGARMTQAAGLKNAMGAA